jgi:hypothetical protein
MVNCRIGELSISPADCGGTNNWFPVGNATRLGLIAEALIHAFDHYGQWWCTCA